MSVLVAGLLMVFLLYALLLAACVAIGVLLPTSFLGAPAKTVLTWLPPFLRGEALRNWAATTAEQLAKKRLTGTRTGATAARLAAEVAEGAMHAMLPTAGSSELERIMACPETGQGMVGVTAPEALAIAAYLRKNRSRAEQQRIYDLAVENAKKIAVRARGEGDAPPLPCPLHGESHVCCVYGTRPLRCRPLHAISIAKDIRRNSAPPAGSQAEAPDEKGHEQTVAQGIELGLTRALKSAGLDAGIYELNSALATALEAPDVAERWAKGENVFHTPLP
jgi:hypothetical protein